MKKGILAIIFIIIIFSFSVFPIGANSAPMSNDGTPSADILSVDVNCPITVESEHLEFDLREVDIYSGFGGKVTATYEMYNPLDKDISIKMAFPYITSLDNLQASSINVSANNQTLPVALYCSYEKTYHRELNSQFTDAQLDINHIIETIQSKQDLMTSVNFDPQRIGYLYKFHFDAIDVILKPNKYDPKMIFDNFVQWTNQEDNSYYYTPLQTGEYIVFSLDNPMNYSVEWNDTHTSGGTPQYEVETERVSAVDYLKSYQVPQISKKYGYAFENALNYCISILDDRLADTQHAVDRSWLYWNDSSIRVLLLVYEVDFEAGKTCTVSVTYPSILTKTGNKGDGVVYEETYLLNPARYWGSFRNLSIAVKTPSFAPYVLEGKANLIETEPGVYTSSFETLPPGNLTFSIYENPEIPLGEELSAKGGIFFRTVVFILYFGFPVIIFVVAVFTVIKIVEKRRDRNSK